MLSQRMHPGVDGRLRELRSSIIQYYSTKLKKYGATPRGVDWTCAATQEFRFVHLLRLCDFSASFSLNDVGCGYGALIAYLAKRHVNADIDYLGVDVAPAMIRCARRLWQNRRDVNFVVSNPSPRIADYSIASGIFNVKLDQPIELWEYFIANTINDMSATSRRGFAINFMESVSGDQRRREQLYQTAPDPWITYCERELGCEVEQLANYGMQEFTLLARHNNQCVGAVALSCSKSGS